MDYWQDIPYEDIYSGKIVFRNVFDVFNYLHKEGGGSFGWYASTIFEVMQIGINRAVAAPRTRHPLP